MKEIVIIGSYSNTKEKLQLLEECINECRKNDLDVLVYGRYPIPESTQRLCNYWIFDKSNPVLDGRLVDFWNSNYGKRTHKLTNDFGFAALEQIIKGLGIVKSFNYESAYWVNYDVDLTNFITVSTPLGLGVTHNLRVTDGNSAYSADTFVESQLLNNYADGITYTK